MGMRERMIKQNVVNEIRSRGQFSRQELEEKLKAEMGEEAETMVNELLEEGKIKINTKAMLSAAD